MVLDDNTTFKVLKIEISGACEIKQKEGEIRELLWTKEKDGGGNGISTGL